MLIVLTQDHGIQINTGKYLSEALTFASTKGQLISKCLFGVIVWTKKTNEIFSRISVLASKNGLNQKLDYTNYVK